MATPSSQPAIESSALLTPPPASTSRSIAAHLHAVDVARLAASLNIYYYHACPRVFILTTCPGLERELDPAVDDVDFIRHPHSDIWCGLAWHGDFWVPFFFLVSGFGTAHASLVAAARKKKTKSPESAADDEPTPDMLASVRALLPSPRVFLRRVASVYPTYLIALMLTVLFTYLYTLDPGQSLNAPAITKEALLVQSFTDNPVAIDAYGDATYNVPGWFISALALLWLLEPLLQALGKRGGASDCRALGLLVATIVWVIVWPWCQVSLLYPTPPPDPGMSTLSSNLTSNLTGIITADAEMSVEERYHDRMAGQSTMLHGLRYVHLYPLGACLAHVLHRRAACGLPAVPYAACIGISCILALGLFMPLNDPEGWDMHNGLLSVYLVPHVLLITGLVEVDADPLARFLSTMPSFAAVCRDLALGVYLFHWPMLTLFVRGPCEETISALPPHGWERNAYSVLVLLATTGVAAAVAYGVQQPFAQMTRKLL